jgi:hypothetical protein
LLAISSCKDPYHVELRNTDQSFLVVDGFLNAGNISTFQLSRSVPLYDATTRKPELRAMLTVEGKDNSVGYFTEKANGVYEAALSFLKVGKEYRLRIHTQDGKEYHSDYVEVKNNPAIDSVSWKQPEDEDVGIYISTHDPGNKTRYYRWEYDETWEIRSTFFALYKRKGDDAIIDRELPKEDVSVCWKYGASTNIILGSSAQLASDVIKENPLITIPRKSDKLERRYSILVRQYALSKEAYEYLQLIKKNTESLGSIFDPLPSEIKGNIHCVSDPKEQVLGIVTAGSVHEQRIFISSNELKGRGYYPYCETFTFPNIKDSIKAYSFLEPYDATMSPSGGIIWLASTPTCVDCTKRGGATRKPAYW